MKRKTGPSVAEPASKRRRTDVAPVEATHQNEMQDTAENELSQIVMEAERNTSNRRITRSFSKKLRGEPTDKGPGAGSKQPTSRKKSSKATKKGKKGKKGKKSNGGDSSDDSDNDDDQNPRRPNNRRQDTTTGFPIKRILAQRQVNGKTEYLVDWLPTWTSRKTASGGKDEVMHEWEWLKAGQKTIQSDTTHKLKIDNPTNDDSMEQMQLMLDQVLEKYTRYMSRAPAVVAAELFRDEDWQFLSTLQENAAKRAANKDESRDDKTPSAAEVLRRAFRHMANNRDWTGANARRYGAIRVQWLANIDADAPAHDGQPAPPGKTVREWLAPLFADELWDNQFMRMESWDKTRPDRHVGPLRDSVTSLVRAAPYMLTQRHPLMLISLFYTAEEITDILDKTDFALEILHRSGPRPSNDDNGDEGNDQADNNNNGAAQNDGWENRARDDFIYAYMDARPWEKRTMESVNITFAACQAWLQAEVDAYLESAE